MHIRKIPLFLMLGIAIAAITSCTNGVQENPDGNDTLAAEPLDTAALELPVYDVREISDDEANNFIESFQDMGVPAFAGCYVLDMTALPENESGRSVMALNGINEAGEKVIILRQTNDEGQIIQDAPVRMHRGMSICSGDCPESTRTRAVSIEQQIADEYRERYIAQMQETPEDFDAISAFHIPLSVIHGMRANGAAWIRVYQAYDGTGRAIVVKGVTANGSFTDILYAVNRTHLCPPMCDIAASGQAGE